MKTKNSVLILGGLYGLLLGGCSVETRESSAAGPTADTVSGSSPTSLSENGVPGLNSPDRRLIHTADLQAEVDDLYASTARIERATLQLQGQVTNSSMRKELLESRTERAGMDSITSYRRYQGHAQLSLRVPVANLDTLLRSIAAQSRFIGSRQVHIDDATFRYLANDLRNRSLSGTEGTVPLAARADGLEARKYLDALRDQSIDRQVQNVTTRDAAAFASLSIDLSQPEELVIDTQPDVPRLMQPGAGHRLLQSLRDGWDILYLVALALISIWPLLILIALGVVFGRRWYRQQRFTGLKS